MASKRDLLVIKIDYSIFTASKIVYGHLMRSD